MMYPKPFIQVMDRFALRTPEAVAWAGVLLLGLLLERGQAGREELEEVLAKARVMDLMVMGSSTEALEGGEGKH